LYCLFLAHTTVLRVESRTQKPAASVVGKCASRKQRGGEIGGVGSVSGIGGEQTLKWQGLRRQCIDRTRLKVPWRGD